MTLIEQTGVAISNAFYDIGTSIVLALPGLIAAVLILVLGYFVGALIGYLVRKILRRTKIIDIFIKKAALEKQCGKWDLVAFLGLIAKWYIFIVFLNPAAEIINLRGMAEFLRAVALWVPNVILAIVIALAGYVLSEYIAEKIRTTKAKKKSMLASTAKVVTLIFVAMIALKQIGIQILIAENTFLIILAGVMLGIAIAFGLGFKDEAKNIMRDLKSKL